MPRSESRTQTAIWDDADFCALSSDAQRLYWMLFTQKTISLCGMVHLRIKRWASTAKDQSEARVTEALKELEERRYIFIDWNTEEVWVRSFIKWDHVCENVKIKAAAWASLQSIDSPHLRALAEARLADCDTNHPQTDEKLTSSSEQSTGFGQFTGPTEGDFVKAQVDRASHPPGYPIPEHDSPCPEDASRARAASFPLPPASFHLPTTPTSSAEAHEGDGVLAPQEGAEGMGMEAALGVAMRMARACRGARDQDTCKRHSVLVVSWASRALDLRVIDEEVGKVMAGKTDVAVANYFVTVLQRRADELGITLPAPPHLGPKNGRDGGPVIITGEDGRSMEVGVLKRAP